MPWIFGYGSIIWRPDFPHEESAVARLDGWERKLVQGSPDHRGVPGRPGRVVTLLRREGAAVWGKAYRVAADRREEVFEQLDLRECAGYELLVEVLTLEDGRQVEGLVYVAGPDNPNFLGPASVEEMVGQIRSCAGASGSNRDYVLSLEKSLSSMGKSDEEISRVAALLTAPDSVALD